MPEIHANAAGLLQMIMNHQPMDADRNQMRLFAAGRRLAVYCAFTVVFYLNCVAVSVSLTLFLPTSSEQFRINVAGYRLVFLSYSHEDAEIVDRLDSYAAAFGDEYLRDMRRLRAGQRWNLELCGFIEKADVFQLFWSGRASQSQFVSEEWNHALRERNSRPDPHFVRPVYWTKEPAPIPSALHAIHFARMPL